MRVGSIWASKAMPLQPMLARPGQSAELSGDGWAMEMKWDGIRAVAQLVDGHARLWSRSGIDITPQFPELIVELESALLGHDLVLDGEIVVFDSDSHPSFELVQHRLGSSPEDSTPLQAHYMLFDVMHIDGQSTIDWNYDHRRSALQEHVFGGQFIHVPPAVGNDFTTAMLQSRELGLEGVVAKRRESTYSPGRRSSDWIKIKHLQAQEAVVGGWLAGKGHRANTVGSLLLGVPVKGARLHYIGRVGSGLREQELRQIALMANESASSLSPFLDVPDEVADLANWIAPHLVCEVQFSGWTQSGRLRHPVWRGWRFDKRPSDVVMEA